MLVDFCLQPKTGGREDSVVAWWCAWCWFHSILSDTVHLCRQTQTILGGTVHLCLQTRTILGGTVHLCLQTRTILGGTVHLTSQMEPEPFSSNLKEMHNMASEVNAKIQSFNISKLNAYKKMQFQYNVTFLKKLQLILDGDVEVNPGPTNNMGTPKGRKMKKKQFNFTPRKLDMHNDEVNVVTKIIPKKLNVGADDISTMNNSFVANICEKISIIQNDITSVKCDAIVNAANVTLLGGGGIDGIIHKVAGPQLLNKCREVSIKETCDDKDIRCYPGECEVMDVTGTNLSNCKYVFHTVGPDLRQNSDENYYTRILKSCYDNCMKKVLQYNIRSIAFCCISTGIYGYPNRDAAVVAVGAVIAWLQANYNSIEKIIFCTYLDIDFKIYTKLVEQTLMETHVKTAVENEKPDVSILEINKIDNASHDVTPKRKGRPTKKETTINSVIRVAESNFQENKITPESSTQISDNSTADVSNPIGLINHANDCFFNS